MECLFVSCWSYFNILISSLFIPNKDLRQLSRAIYNNNNCVQYKRAAVSSTPSISEFAKIILNMKHYRWNSGGGGGNGVCTFALLRYIRHVRSHSSLRSFTLLHLDQLVFGFEVFSKDFNCADSANCQYQHP